MAKKVEKEELEEEYVANPVKNRMSDRTRYIIIGVVTIVLFILVIVLASVGDKNIKNNTTTSSKESNTASTKERNTSTEALKSFYEAFDSKELKVIFFARTSCSYCSLEKPILKQIASDYDIDYYNIDTDELTSTEVQEIMSALGISGSTPTTVIVKEGKVVATNTGYLDGKPYVEFFIKNGILKEGATYKPEEELKSIDYSEFKKIAEKEEASLVLLDDSACPNCIELRSKLNTWASKYKFKVNYLAAKSLSTDEIKSLVENDLKEMNFDNETYKKDGDVSIPLLFVVKDNKIVDYVTESTEESDYIKLLEKNKFIK